MSEEKKKNLGRQDILNLTLEMQFEFETKHYGRLYIFSYSEVDGEKLFSKLSEEGDDCDPDSFVKTLMAMVAYPIGEVDDKNSRPEESYFSEENLDNLSDEELDKFCKLFIEHNTYLAKKPEFKGKKSRDGKNVVEGRPEKLRVEKSDDDNYRQYLLKIFKEDKKKYDKHIDESISRIKENNEFKKKIFKNPFWEKINSRYSALKKMEEKLKGLDRLQGASYMSGVHAPSYQRHNLIDFQNNSSEIQPHPFDRLAERIDVLTEVEGDVVNELKNINESQKDLAKSGWETKQLTKIIIGLTIITFIFSITFSLLISNLTSKRDTENIQLLESQLMDVNKNLQGMSDNSLNAGEGMQDALNQLILQQKAILGELKKLNSAPKKPEE